MYPTLVARAVVVIFMQAFGVSIVVRPSDAISEVHFEESETQKITTNLDDKKNEHEASTGQRLAMLIFLMIVISAFVFYTIYLIVRCIHYVKAYKRLMHRKRSLIIVCHIDPMNQQNSKSRRSSRRSM
uniref:DUF7027 domain-containing protein n=1 Tax=Setaria digitata TaxID=48799 RepID=A0A915PLX7_9BILA